MVRLLGGRLRGIPGAEGGIGARVPRLSNGYLLCGIEPAKTCKELLLP